jgi:hypothetical protein
MLTIAWDVDDVLNDLMHAWYTYKWIPGHSGCNIAYESLVENPPNNILGISREEYLASLDGFRLSKDYEKLKPCGEILQWFHKHGSKARHIALTAVPTVAAHASAGWVTRHFGNWIRTFHFIPSFRDVTYGVCYDRTKVEYIKRVGTIDILVEDNRNNIAGLEDLGKKGLLVSRPWNSSAKSIGDILEELIIIIEAENEKTI